MSDLINEQPSPKPSTGDVWLLVLKDMEERRKLGIEKYGTPVQPFNGRDSLVDAFQEALDLCVYLRQAIEERRMKPVDRPEPYSTWKHTKSAGTYTVLGVAKCSTNGREPEESVIYVSHDYQQIRYRELKEFMDGRFIRVPIKE